MSHRTVPVEQQFPVDLSLLQLLLPLLGSPGGCQVYRSAGCQEVSLRPPVSERVSEEVRRLEYFRLEGECLSICFFKVMNFSGGQKIRVSWEV